MFDPAEMLRDLRYGNYHYTGRCGHNNIAHVRTYNLYCMCLAVLRTLQFLTVTKYSVTV